jgi:hypothetical protein
MGIGWGGADRGQVTEHRRQGDEKIAMVVESHPNVAEGATLGWGTRGGAGHTGYVMVSAVVESHPNVAEGATLGWGTRGRAGHRSRGVRDGFGSGGIPP